MLNLLGLIGQPHPIYAYKINEPPAKMMTLGLCFSSLLPFSFKEILRKGRNINNNTGSFRHRAYDDPPQCHFVQCHFVKVNNLADMCCKAKNVTVTSHLGNTLIKHSHFYSVVGRIITVSHLAAHSFLFFCNVILNSYLDTWRHVSNTLVLCTNIFHR